MDPDALRTFLAIQRSGGFTRAARRLHLSQPAISRRIAMLEHEAGAPLFERIAGGVVLSEAGRVLLPRAERALAALEDCAEAMRSLKGGAAGTISLALVGTLANEELAAVLAKFSRRHPGVALTLRTATSVEVSDLVRRGEATMLARYEGAYDDRLLTGIEPDQAADRVYADAPNHGLNQRLRKLSLFADEEELPDGVMRQHGRSAAATTHHLVVQIDDTHDLGQGRDGLTFGSRRKPAAIPMLVVFQHDTPYLVVENTLFG